MLQRIVRYIRHDLKEILCPSGFPPPPGSPPPPPKRTWKDFKEAWREGTLDYIDSWRRVPKREVHIKYDAEQERKYKVDKEDEIQWEELDKIGRRDLRPFLQKIYYSKGRVLTKTIAEFVEGFHEARQEVESKAKAKAKEGPSRPK